MPPAAAANVIAAKKQSEEVRDLRKPFNVIGKLIIINNVGDEKLQCDFEEKFRELSDDADTKNIKIPTDKHIAKELQPLRTELYKTSECIQQQSNYYGSIVVVVISHQDADGRLQVKDETYSINEITTPFFAQELNDTPKIFLFYIKGDDPEKLSPLPVPVIKAPNCIVCVSPYTGYFEKLCEVLPQWEGRDLDLTSFLCKNNGDVSSLSSSEHLPLPILISSQQKRIILRTKTGDISSDVGHISKCFDISSSKKPGFVLIFNCQTYNKDHLRNRTGSSCNISHLSKTYNKLNFEVRIYDDIDSEYYMKTIKSIAKYDFSSYGCLIVNVMMHTENNMLLLSDGNCCKVSETWEPFKHTPTLSGKPKIFFFEAAASNLEFQELSSKNLQDMIISYACMKNECPKRNSLHGSYFSNHVSEVLATWKDRRLTLTSALIEVNRKVADEDFSQMPTEHMTQNPCFLSFLTKDVKYSLPQAKNVTPAADLNIPIEDDHGEKSPLSVPLKRQASSDKNRTPVRDKTLPVRDTGKFVIPGHLILINNNIGGEHWELDVEKKFAKLDFHIPAKKDIKNISDLQGYLQNTVENIQQNSTDTGCIVVVVISGLDNEGRLQGKIDNLTLSDIVDPFDVPKLEEIPKIIITNYFICDNWQNAHQDPTESFMQNLKKIPNNLCVYISHYDGFFEKLVESLTAEEDSDSGLIILLSKVMTEGRKWRSDNPPLTLTTMQKKVKIRGRFCMFGILEKAETIVNNNFKRMIEEDLIEEFQTSLMKYCEENKDNIKFLAKPLLQLIKDNDRGNILEKLLKYNLPQDEIMNFICEILTESEWKKDLLIKTVNYYRQTKNTDILKLYLNHFTNNRKISGFPIMFVLKNTKLGIDDDYDKVKQKIEKLIKLGADINAYHAYSNEKSPVHYAAEKKLANIVQYFVEEGANIDLKFGTKSTRDIIIENNLMDGDLVRNIQESSAPVITEENTLFKYLYGINEEEFLLYLEHCPVKVNAHDGMHTLLQLAIKNKMKKAAQELINLGADNSAMAGYCKEPILIALEDSNLECINLFAHNTENLELRICNNNATFLHHLARQCGAASVGTRYDNTQEDDKRAALDKLLKASIDQCIHLSAIDESGKTALLICTQNENILLSVLLDNGAFLNIDESIAENIQPDFLEKYLGTKVKYNAKNMELDYNFLKPIKNCDIECNNNIAPEMDPFRELCYFEKFNDVLANSPIVQFFLMRKWKQFAFVYTWNLILSVLFIIFFTALVFIKLNHSQNMGAFATLIVFNVFLCLLLVVREVVQYRVVTLQHYLRNLENYVEILLIIFAFISQIFMIFFTHEDFNDMRCVTSIAVTLAYIDLTLLVGRHPLAEIYIRMFKKVLLNTMILLFIFSSFLFAFAFGFYIIFITDQKKERNGYIQNKNESSVSEQLQERFEGDNYFSNIGYSILKTSTMLLGEFDLGNIKFASSLYFSNILFMLFLVLVPIVLMNVLNALAISDTKVIIDEASIRCCVSNIKLYAKMEHVLLKTSKINPNERCYGLSVKILKHSDWVMSICECFSALKSQIYLNEYKITIEHLKNRNKTVKKFFNISARYNLELREELAAYRLSKANMGRTVISIENKSLDVKDKQEINKIPENISKEIDNIRTELKKTRKEFYQKLTDTNEELKKISACLLRLAPTPATESGLDSAGTASTAGTSSQASSSTGRLMRD